MKFTSIVVIGALLCVASPTALGNTLHRDPKTLIVELTIPDFLNAERIEAPRKKNRGISGGGARGVAHPSPETLEVIKTWRIWSYFYNLSLLKQEKDGALLDFRLSYEADGNHVINKHVEIKLGAVTEVEYPDGIKLKAYFEGDASPRTPPNNHSTGREQS